MVKFSQISYLFIFRYIIQSEKLHHARVVQGEFLKFAPLCNDCQTHPAGIMHRLNLAVAMRGLELFHLYILGTVQILVHSYFDVVSWLLVLEATKLVSEPW